MNVRMIRHGFILILLALLAAFFIPAMAIPRLGLSAHTIGLLSGVLLIAVGGTWNAFRLPSRAGAVLFWSWLYAGYANWLGCLLGAITGAGGTTPVAAAGAGGPAFAEAVVAFLLMSVAAVSLIAVGLSLWGLRPAAAATPG